LPGDTEVSIVDVPGHERFIKNMLAGVGGIDHALLVVAAHEGVMPQTREQLAILDLLGISSGVVALTKRDLVEDEWLELVQADVEETLAGTSLAGAPIVPCSATTGAGLDDLLRTVEARLADTPAKRDIGRPRLAIDRAFTIAGFGTVVTGTLVDGALKLGQEVEILPAGLRSRIRGLQTHRTKVEVARPGSRVAVNLPGLATEQLQRGDVLTTPGWLTPTVAVDVRITAVRDLPRPLRHNMHVTFHTGAAEVEARLRLLDRDEVPAGEEAWAQIRLEHPLAVVRGDRFVIRSSNETLGGGRIVDTRARRHRRHHAPTLSTLTSLSQGTPEDALYALIDRLQPVTVPALARQTELGNDDVARAVTSLVDSRRVFRFGSGEATTDALVLTAPEVDRLTEAMERALAGYFDEHPMRAGMPREELKSRLRLQSRPFAALLAHWIGHDLLRETGSLVAPPGRSVSLSPAQARTADAFLRDLAANPYAPQPAAMPGPELLAYLSEQGRVVAVAEGVAFTREAYDEMVERIIVHLREHGSVTLAQVRDLFGTSRKYAQALLEHMDERRITRRVGDERVLR
jgi:selenocysteine-specific elongation factor